MAIADGGLPDARSWLARAAMAGPEAFATLFALESLARGLLITLIPLEALTIFGSAQAFSSVYFSASLIGLAGGFLIPRLVVAFGRLPIYAAGGLLLMLASACFASAWGPAFALGMAIRLLGAVTLTICSNLYIMDLIPREALTRTEPMRMFYSAGAWTFAPVGGVLLATWVGPWAAWTMSTVCGLGITAYIALLQHNDPRFVRAGARLNVVPQGMLRSIGHFVRQPRLRLAWLIGFGRFGWWTVYYAYAPIFAVQTGLGAIASGVMVSLGASFLFLAPFYSRFMRRVGLRAAFIMGLTGGAVLTASVGMGFAVPHVAAACYVAAAFCMSMLDASGNVLYLAAVKPLERGPMTAVYATHRDCANVFLPGVFAMVLQVVPLQAVFLISALLTLGIAVLATRIHPRLGLARSVTTVRG